ncbi:MAG: carbohydrate kinase [Actinobacteria bacterium]|jgi:xylulokinase|nr:MAG: carbohydrate kinase [Actinomycetota bacterium]
MAYEAGCDLGYLLGYDAGSSSIKAALLQVETGDVVAAAASPAREFAIASPRPGWAEQDPETWWEHLKRATALVRERSGADLGDVDAVGISYQMHGLIIVDRDLEPLRPSIIWCDSRAVPIGEEAFACLGEKACLGRLLNSPGNFTASRVKWIEDNEPGLYGRIHKMMLPGDYLAMKMTGEVVTTPSGLSEMILWDFVDEKPADMLLEYYGIRPELLPAILPTFSLQGEISGAAAAELGLAAGTPVSYRAGDQPNNAFSLKVLDPGDVATTAGTSGVIYGITSRPESDAESRVNVFVHVNHGARNPRYGVLLCVNGTGILYQWLRNVLGGTGKALDYPALNELAATAPAGSAGLAVLPYGNGAERTLGNRNIGASVHGLDLNVHTRAHLLRAAQEGIVFALNYGLEIMRGMGMEMKTARAGRANMFLSPLFGEVFAAVTGAAVELYDTDGAQGAARGAGIGAGLYANPEEAYVGLKKLKVIEPDREAERIYGEAFLRWRGILLDELKREGEVGDGG